MRKNEFLSEEEEKLVEYYIFSSNISRSILEKYNKLMNEFGLLEVTDRNNTWIGLKGIDVSYEKEYEHVKNAYELMTKMQHRSKYEIVISMIDELLSKLHRFSNEKFPDADDTDIIVYKTSASEMIEKLEKMKSNLL